MLHVPRLICLAAVLLVACGGPIPPTESPSTNPTPRAAFWSPTGNMVVMRRGGAYTATLLADGRVLVAGGNNADGPIVNAELFDPTTGTWSVTGSMAVARAYHTATLLNDGRVLVVGGGREFGFSGLDLLPSSELYDPSTGTWSRGADMTTGRWRHTASRLEDGRVLVVGGEKTQGVPSAELYDARRGTWSPAGSLTARRRTFTATVLGNGAVLVAGGVDTNGIDTDPLATAELFDTATETWISAGIMSTGHLFQTAILLVDGRVLVAGGTGSKAVIDTVDLYEPRSNIWERTGNLITARDTHLAVLLMNGIVLVAGGRVPPDYDDTPAAEIYDPVSAKWTATAPMTAGREAGTATLLLDGRVLVTSPTIDGTRTAELYDPGSGT